MLLHEIAWNYFSALFYWINMTLCISEVYLKHGGIPSDVNLQVNYVCGKKNGFYRYFYR